MNISDYGKGAVRTPDHIKAQIPKFGAAPLPAYDWNNPDPLDSVPILNQQQTSACTAHGTVAYGMGLDLIADGAMIDFSRRFIYSQTVLPGGGAYIVDAMNIPINQGFATEASVPDVPCTEAVLTDKSLNAGADIVDKAKILVEIPNNHDIEYLASFMHLYHGAVTGFDGDDQMFLPDGTANIPTSATWGHCVKLARPIIHNGVKSIQFSNSWSAEWGSNGYGFFPQSFVENGPMFDWYAYVSVQDLINSMNDTEIVAALQVLEGYSDPSGQTFWAPQFTADLRAGLVAYLKARLADKISQEQAVLTKLQ